MSKRTKKTKSLKEKIEGNDPGKQPKKAEGIKERKWVKQWLLAFVHPKGDDSIVHVVTAVDVVRGATFVDGKWIAPPESMYEILSSLRKKHWKRSPAYVGKQSDGY